MPATTHPVNVRHLGEVPYSPTLERMHAYTMKRDADSGDEIWLLQHPPVFTLGTNADARHVIAAGDIHQQARHVKWRVLNFITLYSGIPWRRIRRDHRAEPQRPLGEMRQRCPVRLRIVRFHVQRICDRHFYPVPLVWFRVDLDLFGRMVL